MRTIYIDSDFICHADNAEGRTAIQTGILDSICDNALSCYQFTPAHDGKVDYCQCINTDKADAIQRQFVLDSEILNIITGEVSADDEE